MSEFFTYGMVIEMAFYSVVAVLCILIIGFLFSLFFVAFTSGFNWVLMLFVISVLPLYLAQVIFPAIRDLPYIGHPQAAWVLGWLGVMGITKFLHAPRIARKCRKELTFNGAFNVSLPPEKLWEMLVPLPEHKNTLFSTSISGIEIVDSEQQRYKIYTNDSGEQEPSEIRVTSLVKNKEFIATSTGRDSNGFPVSHTGTLRFVQRGDSTNIFVSEHENSISFVHWAYNKFNASHGDYYDGFVAYCNGTRDWSMRGMGRKKRALERS
jgi:hypothetical protein